MDEYIKRDLFHITIFFGFCFLFSGIVRFFMEDKSIEINILIVLIGLCLMAFGIVFDFGTNLSEVKR